MIRKLTLIAVIAIAILTLTPSAEAKKTILHVPEDYESIQEAVDAAANGDTIIVAAGTYKGAVITKSVEIKGSKGATIIDDGPSYRQYDDSEIYWLRTAFRIDDNDADGAVISHMIINCNQNYPERSMFFAVFSRGADDVTVSHITIYGPVQAISNYHGNGWVISNNIINDIEAYGGGGIGILVGSVDSSPATHNVIAHNTITSESLDVVPPAYSCPGILLISDRRYGRSGGPVENNKIVHNKVNVGRYLYACGFEIDDWTAYLYPNDDKYDVVDNKIGFNDVRGCPYAAIYYPDSDWGDPLDAKSMNTISRNLTDDGQGRGHGVTPASIFNETDIE